MNSFRFLSEDSGQDMTEYALLLAFVCLASAAIFVMSGASFNGIWSTANNHLEQANKVS
jgi:Flp pilus assembly pilin Flp